MLIERTQPRKFHDNDTLMHNVNSVFVKKPASRIISMINLEI